MLSTWQDEACNEEEREVQEYDGDLELVMPFLTLLKEMSGFIFFAVKNKAVLYLCCKFTHTQVVGFFIPACPTIQSNILESSLQMCDND